MANYSYAKFTDVVDAVARRLYNPDKTQWVQPELEDLLKESLRTWNALSQFWREEFTFSLATDTWWYDLRAVAGTLIPYTVTQYDIITKIKRYLLEPPDPAFSQSDDTLGSSQFTLGDVLQACQRRQDETLGITACTIDRTVLDAPLVNRCVLPDTTIDIRRVAWLPASTDYSNRILKQTDAFAARAFGPRYAQAGQKPPGRWMQNTQPPPAFDVDTPPPVNGNYEVMHTASGPPWVKATDKLLNMPDDWSWVFTFGALGDLFSRESLAQDTLRAAYCRARYQEGLGLMRMMPVAVTLRYNDKPVSIGSVTGADKFNARWQAEAAGAPRSFYEFMNYLAVAPKPDNDTDYSVAITVCKNMPVDEFYVQVPHDDLDTVIDYAQHLGMLKRGGQEFYQSIALYQNLQRKTSQYNSKLKEMGFFEMTQLDFATLEETRNPRYQKGSEPQATASE